MSNPHNSLDSTCFEVQGVSGPKPSDLPGQGKALTAGPRSGGGGAAAAAAGVRRGCRRVVVPPRFVTWRVPPRGGSAEVRHKASELGYHGHGSSELQALKFQDGKCVVDRAVEALMHTTYAVGVLRAAAGPGKAGSARRPVKYMVCLALHLHHRTPVSPRLLTCPCTNARVGPPPATSTQKGCHQTQPSSGRDFPVNCTPLPIPLALVTST